MPRHDRLRDTIPVFCDAYDAAQDGPLYVGPFKPTGYRDGLILNFIYGDLVGGRLTFEVQDSSDQLTWETVPNGGATLTGGPDTFPVTLERNLLKLHLRVVITTSLAAGGIPPLTVGVFEYMSKNTSNEVHPDVTFEEFA